MLAGKTITLALLGLVVLFACCVLANNERGGMEIREVSKCSHIELSSTVGDKSLAGRRAFKAAKRDALRACSECCHGLGWKYEYFTYKGNPRQCQCANKFKHVVSAD